MVLDNGAAPIIRPRVDMTFANEIRKGFDVIEAQAKALGEKLTDLSATALSVDGISLSLVDVGPESVTAALEQTRKLVEKTGEWIKEQRVLNMERLRTARAKFDGAVAGMARAVKGTRAWALAQRALNAVMRLNPIGLVITAITALVIGLVIAYKRSTTFRNIVNGVFRAVRSVVLGVIGNLVGGFRRMMRGLGLITNAARAVVGWLRRNWRLVLGILTGPFGIAVILIRRNWDRIVGFFSRMPGRIAGIARNMWTGLTDAFRGAVNNIIRMWNDLSFTLDIPDIIPGLPGELKLNTPNIPFMATGGIVTQATLAVVGEAGPEAVVPLAQYEAQRSTGSIKPARFQPGAAAGAASSSRTEFVITNWKKGEGFFREIAEHTYHGEQQFAGQRRRMR